MKKSSFYCIKKSKMNFPSNSERDSTDPFLKTSHFDTFTYANNKITQKYSFGTGNTILFADNGDDSVSYLYESFHDKTGDHSFIYTTDGFYNIFSNGDNHIESIIYLSSKNFQAIKEKLEHSKSLSFFHSFYKKGLEFYMITHSTPVVMRGKLVDDSPSLNQHLKKAKKLLIRYSLVSQYIPANSILETLLKMTHHYIATQQIDFEAFLAHYTNLQNFQNVCSDSIYEISKFITDYKKMDLRNFCEKLEKKSHNISNLIDMYLKDELER